MAARGDSLARALELIRELLAAPASVVELAERLECGVRTVRRDLRALGEAGIAVAELREGRSIRYRVALEDVIAALSVPPRRSGGSR